MNSYSDASGKLIEMLFDEIDNNPKLEERLSQVAPTIAKTVVTVATGNSTAGSAVGAGVSFTNKNTSAKVGGAIAASALISVGSIIATPVIIGWFAYEGIKKLFSED